MHLTAGATGAIPLHVVDQDGNPVPGTLTFSVSAPEGLVSISQDGNVTALRAENTETEIGVWINATLNGQPILSNSCVVRVLPENYGVPFAEVSGARTTLYYPTTVNGLRYCCAGEPNLKYLPSTSMPTRLSPADGDQPL